jgi:starch-binding outer membrane protein SusE/F
MKNNFKYLFFAPAIVLAFASCKKEENRITFEGGTPPVLTASSTAAQVLDSTKKNQQAIKFSWTNPDYKFTTGVNSQDVVYILEVDTAGANFTNPKRAEVSISKDKEVTYTVKELNALVSRVEVAENKPHNMEFRIKSTLAGGTVPLYSNVIRITITPYLDVAVPLPPTNQLFITGDATPSGWTNSPPLPQKAAPVTSSLTQSGYTSYTITIPLSPGKYYKFLSTPGAWQPQYGGKDANGGDIGYNMGLPGQTDPDAIPTPAAAGLYKITLNFRTGKYTVEKQ